jgi:putative transcriptional regulator
MIHHPDHALLLSYASGACDEATALILATHLTLCPDCREAVALAETVGGTLLQDMPPAALAPSAYADTLQRLDAPAPMAPARPRSADGTPAPLRAYMGRDLKDVRWRKIASGISYFPLHRAHGVVANLLRVSPGGDVGIHDHGGLEMTLVLAGGYQDATGRYAKGDLQVALPGLEHKPVADNDGDCINLTVTHARLRFRAPLARVAGLLFGF